MPEEGSISIEQLLLTRLSKSDFKKWVENSSAPYKELMAYYRCAIMEIETKFKVLNEELSIQYDRNPIETIKSRLKSPESIFDKIARKGCPLTVESIEENITDIAGVRVNETCRFAAGRTIRCRMPMHFCKLYSVHCDTENRGNNNQQDR